MRTSEAINEVAAALALAQAAMRPAIKDANNPAFRSRYADLASVWDAAREPLTKNGLAVVQDVVLDEGGIAVTTRLMHKSGQWIEFGPLMVPLAKRDAHGVGSATSYAKRYGLSGAVGISTAEQDDDGNGAVSSKQYESPPAVERAPTNEELTALQNLRDAALNGMEALQTAWAALPKPIQAAMSRHKPALKAAAAKAKPVLEAAE